MKKNLLLKKKKINLLLTAYLFKNTRFLFLEIIKDKLKKPFKINKERIIDNNGWILKSVIYKKCLIFVLVLFW